MQKVKDFFHLMGNPVILSPVALCFRYILGWKYPQPILIGTLSRNFGWAADQSWIGHTLRKDPDHTGRPKQTWWWIVAIKAKNIGKLWSQIKRETLDHSRLTTCLFHLGTEYVKRADSVELLPSTSINFFIYLTGNIFDRNIFNCQISVTLC